MQLKGWLTAVAGYLATVLVLLWIDAPLRLPHYALFTLAYTLIWFTVSARHHSS